MDITVVGAGIVGLTTAYVLQGSGHRVRVLAAAPGSRTVSSVAGAVWTPYQVGPADKVAGWASTSRDWLAALPHEAGVDVLDAYEISHAAPTFTAATPAPAPVTGSPAAWRFHAPRAEPALLLAYLARDLSIDTRDVADLADVPGDVVVNCTGLGARTLVRDPHLEPLFGQTVIVGLGGWSPRVTVTDDRDPDAIFYAIPRRSELVLGGCALRGRDAEDPAVTARILAHAKRLGVAIGDVHAVRTGQRPFRPTVRLERDGRVIHNYGHGGAGFTLAYGCAVEVQTLITPP